MSLLLLTGIFGIVLVLVYKKTLMNKIGTTSKMVQRLSQATWFYNHWLAGLFLFALNTALFFTTGFLLYLLTLVLIPFVHLFVMTGAVIASILLWVVLSQTWRGTKENRLKMSATGSSVYLILTVLFGYFFVTLEPSYEGQDTFMAAIGLLFAAIVTTVAFLTCLTITGLYGKKSTGA
ncbi:hypothetical protein JSY36_05895 [Bacillus sp. H-16]|uniref:hypothetical protein n=1 Tax=Alteribacter salitolerans TaxID=2912333 RepID=UPI0019656D5D|nr:hypothetical protein [Alteribacter salitolerans]MBM7095282.1 hypothetical protein [Alteribacter salitolerans]